MAGRIFQIGERKPFLGHPEASPPAARGAAQSLKLTPNVTKLPTARTRKPKTKRGKQINPPAIRAGVVAFFDGSLGQHGAAFGAVVYREGRRIHQAAERVITASESSSNLAEYAGVVNVLRFFHREGITEGTIYGDSLLVVKQLNGHWKARAGVYLPMYHEAIKLRERLPKVRLVWVSRNHNGEADKLSKRPLNHL